MKILVLGGTRFFGIPMLEKLLSDGHDVTIATRGITPDPFEDRVSRIIFDLYDYDDVEKKLGGTVWDTVIDKITYSSNELKAVMDAVSCEKFLHMSTCSVYEADHYEVREEEFDPLQGEVLWNDRMEAPYAVNKQRAERVLFRYHGKQTQKKKISVRYPFVVGPHDYTERLRFYVRHLLRREPMWIDDQDAQIGFIEERSAGEFFAFLAGTDFEGTINGAAAGTISPAEILAYLTKKTGLEPVLSTEGEAAPYNGMVSHSYSLHRARSLGYEFSDIRTWFFDLLDTYLEEET